MPGSLCNSALMHFFILYIITFLGARLSGWEALVGSSVPVLLVGLPLHMLHLSAHCSADAHYWKQYPGHKPV